MFESAKGPACYGDLLVGVAEEVGNKLLQELGICFDVFSMDPANPNQSGADPLRRLFQNLSAEAQEILSDQRLSQIEKFIYATAVIGRSRNAEDVKGEGDILAVHKTFNALGQIISTSRHNVQSRLVSPVGSDGVFGNIMAEAAEVDRGYRVPGSPGMYWKQYVGENRTYKPAFNRRFSGSRDFLSSSKHRAKIVADAKRQGLFFTNLNAMGMTRRVQDFLSLLRELKAARVPVVFDTNYRTFVIEQCFAEQFAAAGEFVCSKEQAFTNIRKSFEDVLPYVRLLLGGREDLQKIYGCPGEGVEALFRRLRSSGHMDGKLSLIKADEQGIYSSDAAGRVDHVPLDVVVPAKDAHPGGAGDATNAAIIFGLTNGIPFMQAIRFANGIGRCAVRTRSLIMEQEELRDLLLAETDTRFMPQQWIVCPKGD